jgi:hypothetical protein
MAVMAINPYEAPQERIEKPKWKGLYPEVKIAIAVAFIILALAVFFGWAFRQAATLPPPDRDTSENYAPIDT